MCLKQQHILEQRELALLGSSFFLGYHSSTIILLTSAKRQLNTTVKSAHPCLSPKSAMVVEPRKLFILLLDFLSGTTDDQLYRFHCRLALYIALSYISSEMLV